MTILEALDADPPGCEMPPACGPVNPKSDARRLVTCFSMRVSVGETW